MRHGNRKKKNEKKNKLQLGVKKSPMTLVSKNWLVNTAAVFGCASCRVPEDKQRKLDSIVEAVWDYYSDCVHLLNASVQHSLLRVRSASCCLVGGNGTYIRIQRDLCLPCVCVTRRWSTDVCVPEASLRFISCLSLCTRYTS